MNDAQLLERLAMTDPYPADTEMPAAAWSPEVAFAEVEERIGAGLPDSRRPSPVLPRRGWLVAVAAFIVVLVAGGVLFATLGGREETQPVAPVTTTTPPPTTAAPSPPAPTTPSPATTGEALEPELQSLLADFERAYNRGDVDAVTALVAPDASLTPAASVDSGDAPVTVSVVEHLAAAVPFEETIRVGECSQLDAEITCQVTVADRFADALELEPWVQTWSIDIDADQIVRITASGESPARVAALSEFQQFVRERDPDAPPLLASDHQLDRTEAVRQTVATHLVEFGALRSGIPAETWTLVSGFYESLSDGDIAGAEALFAPGGRYFSTEWDDVMTTALSPSSDVVGSPEMAEYLRWWHGMLQMDLTPRSCTGDATTVTCTADADGILVLYLPGRTATGAIEFTLGPDGIEVVENRIITGSTASSEFHIRGFWRSWMPDNAPEAEALWPNGNGEIPHTADMARAIIEYYLPYLADHGVSVPPEYFDTTLLADF
jgi:ketosteroid isomerase-like protein